MTSSARGSSPGGPTTARERHGPPHGARRAADLSWFRGRHADAGPLSAALTSRSPHLPTRPHSHPPRSQPPLGWRSWNLYGPNVDQQLIISVMDGMLVKNLKAWDGNTYSLSDLGFKDGA